MVCAISRYLPRSAAAILGLLFPSSQADHLRLNCGPSLAADEKSEMPVATIIVSDRDRAICELYTDLFDDAGYLTRVISPQTTSAASIGAAQADIALLEVMPVAPLDSLTLVRQLRACPATAHLPLVLLSTLPALVEWLRPSLDQLGCTALAKPFQVDELLAHVERLLEARPSQAALASAFAEAYAAV